MIDKARSRSSTRTSREFTARQLLLVEDDTVFATELSEFLSVHGFEVSWLPSYENIISRLTMFPVDMVVLDQFVGDQDALPLLSQIRKVHDGGVVFLTGNKDSIERIVALENGADDFIAKSLVPRELLARLRAVMRRFEPDPANSPAHTLRQRKDTAPEHRAADPTMNWSVDPVRQHVIAPNGAILKLSDLEWRTLECLARRCSQLVTRQELAEQVWKRPLNPEDRSIDITISRIRKMIQPYMDGHPTIRSVRGRGYIFTAFDLPPSHDLPISPPSSDPILDGNERA